MTTSRVITATAILALVAGATAADAAPRRKPAPKPVCNLVKDAKGDATEALQTSGPNDPALDVVSADIATNAADVTVVWRLASLAGDTTSWPAGRGYSFQFKVHGNLNVLLAVVAPSGQLWQNGKGRGSVDSAKNEIHMTVPIAQLKEKFKPNEKLTELFATTWRMAGNTETKLGRADEANGAAPYYYQASYPSCVKVGA